MASTRRELMALIERNVIPPEQVSRAVKVAGVQPSPREWAVLVDRLLLMQGDYMALNFELSNDIQRTLPAMVDFG